MTRYFPWLLLVGAVVLGPAPSAEAGSCSQNCAARCPGGCSIDIPGCGVACTSSGCTATCKGLGGTQPDCASSVSVTCEEEDPPPPRGEPPKKSQFKGGRIAEWALLRRPADTTTPLTVDDVEVVAASSADYAMKATSALLARTPQAPRAFRRPDDSGEAHPGFPWRPAMGTPELFVAPANGHSVQFEVALVNRTFPRALESTTEAYVKGLTDGSGRLASLEVLYARLPELNAEITSFALDNLRVWSPEAAGMPLEFFGAVHVAADREVGYLVGGVFAPAEFERPAR